MADRGFATKELATLLGILAHPERIRIVEELRDGELDVASLQKLLGIAHSRVSQNLGILRSHRVVAERREGRHVFYHLVQPRIASWLLDAMNFLEGDANFTDEIRTALGKARARWGTPEANSLNAGVGISAVHVATEHHTSEPGGSSAV